jgi:hypothetical protein
MSNTLEQDQMADLGTVEETAVLIETESTIVTEEVPPVTTYSVFIPDFTQSTTLISSTHNRYNDTIQSCLEKDESIIQQKVALAEQSENNNFFRNAKW